MKINNLLIASLFVIFSLVQSQVQPPFQPEGDLLFVIEVFRHGARYTIYEQFWDGKDQFQDAGELSPTGMRQHYTLGQSLREEYVDKKKFLLPQFNHTQIAIISTDFNRTMMSAYSHFQGLYPPYQGPLVSDNITNANCLFPPYQNANQTKLPLGLGNQSLPQQIQVLPVHTLPSAYDIYLSAEWNCESLIEEEQAKFRLQNNYLQQIDKQYKETYQNLKKVVNYSGEINFGNVENLYDVLIADLYNGRGLPVGMTDQLWNNITELDTLWWAEKYAGSQIVNQLSQSNLLNEFLELMDNKISDPQNNLLRWASFSAHDSNIAPLMFTFGLFDINCTMNKYLGTNYTQKIQNCFNRPAYASNIIIELYNTTNQGVQVSLKYLGQYVTPNNSKSLTCSYADFKKYIQQTATLTLTQWGQTCNYTIPPYGIEGLQKYYQEQQKEIKQKQDIISAYNQEIDNENQNLGVFRIISLLFGFIVLGLLFVVGKQLLNQKLQKQINLQENQIKQGISHLAQEQF